MNDTMWWALLDWAPLNRNFFQLCNLKKKALLEMLGNGDLFFAYLIFLPLIILTCPLLLEGRLIHLPILSGILPRTLVCLL